jgi:hypothetical protein
MMFGTDRARVCNQMIGPTDRPEMLQAHWLHQSSIPVVGDIETPYIDDRNYRPPLSFVKELLRPGKFGL